MQIETPISLRKWTDRCLNNKQINYRFSSSSEQLVDSRKKDCVELTTDYKTMGQYMIFTNFGKIPANAYNKTSLILDKI